MDSNIFNFPSQSKIPLDRDEISPAEGLCMMEAFFKIKKRTDRLAAILMVERLEVDRNQ